MADRKQCPFCLAYRALRADGTLPHHRLSNGKLCAGAFRGLKEAKQAKAEGVPIAAPSGRTDKQVDPEDIF